MLLTKVATKVKYCALVCMEGIFVKLFIRGVASLETTCSVCLCELACEDNICTTPTLQHAFVHFFFIKGLLTEINI